MNGKKPATFLREKECACKSSAAFTVQADTLFWHKNTRTLEFPSTMGPVAEVTYYLCGFWDVMKTGAKEVLVD